VVNRAIGVPETVDHLGKQERIGRLPSPGTSNNDESELRPAADFQEGPNGMRPLLAIDRVAHTSSHRGAPLGAPALAGVDQRDADGKGNCKCKDRPETIGQALISCVTRSCRQFFAAGRRTAANRLTVRSAYPTHQAGRGTLPRTSAEAECRFGCDDPRCAGPVR